MYEIKTKDVSKILAAIKKCSISVIIRLSQTHSNTLVIGKIKEEIGSVAIQEFVGLKPKIYSFLVDNNKHKKAKGVNKNVVATTRHNEYKDVLLNNKCIRHSMNIMQS